MPVSLFLRRALPAGAAFGLLLGTAHCTSLLGDFDAGTGNGSPDSSLSDGSSSSSSGGGDDAQNNPDAPLRNEAGILLGTACTSATDCGGGPCVDGVCCDVPCDGVCMRCDIATSKGTCTPAPAMTDPDKECLMATIVVADAGAVADAAPADGGDAGDASDEGGALDAGIADAATDGQVLEAGPVINYPDGGLMPDGGPCAGSCNGHGACQYPAVETGCGAQFCNDGQNLARTTCDGTGRCQNIDVEPCKDFACEANACKTTCTGPSDCLDTDRCVTGSGGTQVCEPKLSNGQRCDFPTDCDSNYCVPVSGGASVCCNSQCDAAHFPGGNCAATSTTTGECTCPACTTGACAVFYPDNDNDGYGDKFAVVATSNATAANAVVACAGTPPTTSAQYPAAHYVSDNTDCSDSDNTTYPGAGFSVSPVVGGQGAGGYDHDCDGVTTQEYKTYPSGTTCHVCTSDPSSCGTSSCGASGAESFGTLSCATEYGNCCSCFILEEQPLTTQSLIKTNQSINPDLIIRPLCCSCTTESCGPNDRAGFVSGSGSTPVACGSYGEYYSCGTCSSTTLGATTYSSVQQGCR
ncbi:MAG TPA: hypothetical protein VHV30_03165 [Polyangiaceae bacterium]|jgi:hypothetical protein|nr:hypothetical protein [Polyangiaceae bacterium]